MRSRKLLLPVLCIALYLGAVAACASVPRLPDPLPLDQQTLDIAEDFAGAEYRYEVCVKKIIICVKYEWRRDTYDLTDPAVRKKLIDIGFVLKTRERSQ